ncbi:hypothetical protein AYO44_16420 [Planctomycetaceae bacterium SCGC AG-212-F19]|nr:hypothetical protein AYO44_16420 [Planctomycetaceae bacterium SCGC AG-212-F19]
MILKEQVVLAVIQGAVAIAKDPLGPVSITEQVAQMVELFLASSAARSVPGALLRSLTLPARPQSYPPSAVVLGFDEPWVEGLGHVPW